MGCDRNTKWRLRIHWSVGGIGLRETSDFLFATRPSDQEILTETKWLARRTAERFLYDCGREDRPLHPRIDSASVVEEHEPIEVDKRLYHHPDILSPKRAGESGS